ncbi:ABC transporter substrate-binding protein [Cohnella sp. GCM10012308]|uniref:ABC transporter substrate-binding protein n=1 Tax=Cohnella sp. GCM10012308 TaxID=3317329 RepID=UPI003610FB9B
MRKTRSTAFFVLTALLSLSLAACSGSNNGNGNASSSAPASSAAPSAGGSASPSDAPIEADITVMHFWSNADDTIKEIAKNFEQENPGIHVKVNLSSVANHYTDLTQRIQSNDTPEIFTVWPGASVNPYYDSGVLADLSNMPWAGEINSTAKTISTYDNKLVLAPVNTAIMALAYNKDVFDRLGLQPPQNYADFEHILQTLKDDPAIKTPFINGADFLLNIASLQAVTDVYAKQPDFDAKVGAGEEKFNNEAFTNLFKRMLIDWPDKGYVNGSTMLSTDRMSKAVLQFIDGKAGIMELGGWDIPVLNQLADGKKVNIGMFPFPAQDGKGSVLAAAGEAFAMSANAAGAKKEAAEKFLSYLMNDENNAKICAAINSLSAKPNVKAEVDPILATLSGYMNAAPTYGFMTWPMEVQNNLKNLGNVMLEKKDADAKLKVLNAELQNLQTAWMSDAQK